MAYVFNPFTGNFDVVDTNTAAGSDTQVQFNDGGTLAGDTALTWNKTSDQLTVGGDINLDSGGNFSTTIQSVTPTANRTISFPDQTGTVGLVSGATGNIQYNNAGQLAGTGDLTVDLNWTDTLVTYTGLKVNVTDTGSAAGSKLLDLQSGGTTQAYIDADGSLVGKAAGALYQAIRWNSIWSGGATLYDRTYAIASWGVNVGGFEGGIILHNKALGWATGANNSVDLSISRDAADTLAQRRGTNAQTYRLYNTYTDASNYERGYLQWNSNVLELGTEGLGTGNARNLKLSGPSASSSLTFSSAGIQTTDHVQISSAFRAGGNTVVAINTAYQLGFTSTSSITSAIDTGFARDSAGVVAVTDGSTGTGYLKQTPVPFGTINAITLSAGIRGLISDSDVAAAGNFGAVVNGTNTGTGSNVVPVYYDGTDWMIG